MAPAYLAGHPITLPKIPAALFLSLPDCLEITGWTETSDGKIDEIMGVKHREMQIEGVQFHPESILTLQGHDLLRNFLNIVENSNQRSG